MRFGRGKRSKQVSLVSLCNFFPSLQKMNFRLIRWVYCKWEEALLSHENMQEGVFPTSIFTNIKLNLSSVGCELHKLENLALSRILMFWVSGLFCWFFFFSFQMRYHLELIYTKEILRLFVAIAFIRSQLCLMTGTLLA